MNHASVICLLCVLLVIRSHSTDDSVTTAVTDLTHNHPTSQSLTTSSPSAHPTSKPFPESTLTHADDSTAETTISLRKAKELSDTKPTNRFRKIVGFAKPVKQPKRLERAIVKTERLELKLICSVGSVTVIWATAFAIFVFVALRDFSIERCLQMSEEAVLFLIYLFVLLLRKSYTDETLCWLVSTILHYLYSVLFLFLLLESVHCYAIITSMVRIGALWDKRKQTAFGWIAPIPVILVAAFGLRLHFPSGNSCWVNWSYDPLLCLFLASVVGLGSAAFVVVESAGMWYCRPIPNHSVRQRQHALWNQRALYVLLPLHMLAAIWGSFAIYQGDDIYQYSFALFLNIGLAISIVVFHAVSHSAVRALLWRALLRLNPRFYAPKITLKKTHVQCNVLDTLKFDEKSGYAMFRKKNQRKS